MRSFPLILLTLAMACAEDGPPDTGREGWKRPVDREPVDDWSERTGVPSPFPCRADMVWCESAKTDRTNPDGTAVGCWVPSAAWQAPGPFAALHRKNPDDWTEAGDGLLARYFSAHLKGLVSGNEWRLYDTADGPSIAGGESETGTGAMKDCEKAAAAAAYVTPPLRRVEGVIGSYILPDTAREVADVLASQMIEARVEKVGANYAVFAKVNVPHEARMTVDHTVQAAAVAEWARSCGLPPSVVQVDTDETPYSPALICGFAEPAMANHLAEVLTRAGVKAWVAPAADGEAFGVFASVQVATEPTGEAPDEPFPEPRDGEKLWAYVARLSREEGLGLWPDGPDGEPAHPLDTYRRVEGEGGRVATFVLAPYDRFIVRPADDSH